ncbi:nuclease-related domain-containing protein [Streptomyces tardus]|uniref:nuclease-related domain-containing protein n=1 Tax=Streptomyces tardus TaxID=2780544 RepID=UPI001F18AEE5|nr:nuclease-related domain-containing protein [Streptomyces tardus]
MRGTPEDGRLWLHPDDDLAPNRPGESLHRPGESVQRGALARSIARLLGRPLPERDTASALLAAERVADELEQLELGGWYVLHSLPLPDGTELGHLLIGPGGTYTVSSRWYPAARAEVRDGDTVHGAALPLPLVRHCRRGAVQAAHVLSRAAGTEVPVTAVLVLVGAHRVVRSAAAADDVAVLSDGNVRGHFLRCGGVLGPAWAAGLHALARDRRTWRAG